MPSWVARAHARQDTEQMRFMHAPQIYIPEHLILHAIKGCCFDLIVFDVIRFVMLNHVDSLLFDVDGTGSILHFV